MSPIYRSWNNILFSKIKKWTFFVGFLCNSKKICSYIYSDPDEVALLTIFNNIANNPGEESCTWYDFGVVSVELDFHPTLLETPYSDKQWIWWFGLHLVWIAMFWCLTILENVFGNRDASWLILRHFSCCHSNAEFSFGSYLLAVTDYVILFS